MLTNMSFSTYILSDNNLGNEGLVYIANAIKNTKHIIKLDVSSNGVTYEGIACLRCNNLKTNLSLT